jgi:hypothetical protein
MEQAGSLVSAALIMFDFLGELRKSTSLRAFCQYDDKEFEIVKKEEHPRRGAKLSA